MFIIDLHYTAPLAEIDSHMNAHMQFLRRQYAANRFLISGRKEPRTGGIIVATGGTKAEVESLMREDPFVAEGLATFTLTEFRASQKHPLLKGIE